MRTIQEHWDSFEKAVLPKDASPIQVQETRRAFYGGAQSMIFALMEMGDSDVSEEAGANILEGYNQELSEFSKRIGIDV
jgi:hypothetical protein